MAELARRTASFDLLQIRATTHELKDMTRNDMLAPSLVAGLGYCISIGRKTSYFKNNTAAKQIITCHSLLLFF